jgi:AcrR family transcriptional regulator
MANEAGRRSPDPEALKEEVIRAASALIAERGIEDTSMRQIADAAGVSTGTINHHFGNKRGLVIAAMDFTYALRDREQYRRLSPTAQLKRLMQSWVLTPTIRRWAKFWLEYVSHAGRDDELRARHEERYVRQRRFYVRIFREGMASGEFRSDLDPEDVADTWLALLNGMAVNQIVSGDTVSPERARWLIEAFLATLEGRTPEHQEARHEETSRRDGDR